MDVASVVPAQIHAANLSAMCHLVLDGVNSLPTYDNAYLPRGPRRRDPLGRA